MTTLLGRFKHGVDVIKFKADQLMRINRVQGEIRDLRRDISNIHVKISSTAVELHKKGALSNPELVDLCVAIDQLNKQIFEKEANIAAIRNEEVPHLPPSTYQYAPINPCPKCNSDVPIGAEFCTNCGNPMPTTSVTDSVKTVSSKIACTYCKALIPANAEFCPECGQLLTPSE